MEQSRYPADPIPMGYTNAAGLVVPITEADPLPTSGGGGGGGNVTVDNGAGNAVYVRPGTGVNLNTSAVTVSAALPAGTNTIGKLAANSGVDIGDVDVTSVAAPTTVRNAQETVGTSAAAFASSVALQGFTIKASRLNAGIVYLGGSSGVTSSNGFPLAAGEQVFVACANANQIYGIASQASQNVSLVGS
jgi:hypothetical protein